MDDAEDEFLLKYRLRLVACQQLCKFFISLLIGTNITLRWILALGLTVSSADISTTKLKHVATLELKQIPCLLTKHEILQVSQGLARFD